MKKLISLILACIFVFTLLPGTASATDLTNNGIVKIDNNNTTDKLSNSDILGKPTLGKDDPTLSNDKPSSEDLTISYGGGAVGIPMPDDVVENDDDDNDDGEAYLPHTDEDKIIGYGCDTKYHWKQCSCGCKIGMELHVDPKDTSDDTCICGYHFSDNADLVTLWVKGCPGIKYFDKNKTEYTLDAYTYKDIKEIKISTRTHDSEATVELPEDLTLKEGENKFEVKVTAENQKVTKVYTLIINKEAKK